MLSADHGKDSPNSSTTVDPDKARPPFVLRLSLVLHWLQRYLENHPDNRDVVLKAVTVPKLLPTPATTPSNTDIPGEPAPAPIPSRFIEQEVRSNSDRDADQHASPFIEPHDQSSRAVDNRNESLFVDPHDHSSPATQQGGGHGVPQYQAYVEDAEDSSGDSQPSANLDDWIPSCDGDDRQDGLSSSDSQNAANLFPSSDRQDGKLLRQGAMSSKSQQSNKSSKRKQNFGDRKGPKRLQIKALDLRSRSPQLQSAPDRKDETHGRRLDTSDASQDSGFLASSATLPSSPTTPEKGCGSRQSPTEHNPSAEYIIIFTDLRADLRAKAQMIGDIKTRAVAWHFFNYIESWYSGPTNCSNAEPNPNSDVPSTSLSDQRLRKLKVGIITQEETETSTTNMKIVARVFKRVYLAELACKYKEETRARKAEPKTRSKENLPVLSVKNRYINVLFPETITCEGKQQSKKKGKQLSKKEIDPRKKAKGKLEYWLKLGRFLAKIAKRYGVGIILLLPKKLTDKDLHLFPWHQMKSFLDYIDILHPDLREDLSDLSALLPSIVENGLPSKRIVLETYPSDQLSHLCNRPLKELFQFCTGTDSHRAYATAGAALGQDPSNVTYSEYPSAPTPQGGFIHPLKIDQQVDMAAEEPFRSQNGDLPPKPLGHYGGEPRYVNKSINSYQFNTTGGMPTSVAHSNFSIHPADMSEGLGWTGNYQVTTTVNPRDLLLRAA